MPKTKPPSPSQSQSEQESNLMHEQTLREFYLPKERVQPFDALRKSQEFNRYRCQAEHSKITQT